MSVSVALLGDGAVYWNRLRWTSSRPSVVRGCLRARLETLPGGLFVEFVARDLSFLIWSSFLDHDKLICSMIEMYFVSIELMFS